MSFVETSRAMAMLIRLPDHNRGEDLKKLLADFDLTEREEKQLLDLADNREVLKFGNKMRKGRMMYLREAIPVTLEYIPFDVFAGLLKEHFDPSNTKVDRLDLFEAYLRFFFKHKLAHDVVKGEGPEFIMDILKFEILQSIFEFGGFENRNHVPEGSLLQGMGHELVTLDYDVPGFFQETKQDEEFDYSTAVPEKNKVYLLFVDSEDDGAGYRMFQIDEEHFNFIKLLEQPNPVIESFPPCYDDFAELGLVKRRS